MPQATTSHDNEERSAETICLPSTVQVSLPQGLMAEGTWLKNSHCPTEKPSTLTAL